MKRSFYILISLFFITFIISSCSFETDTVAGDGDMEGMWHLERITNTTSTDSITHESTVDLSNKRIFWSFQHKLLQLQDYDLKDTLILCRFDIADGKLSLSEFYLDHNNADSLTEDASYLLRYGINSINPVYNYSIDGSRLTLRTDSSVLSFKRF